MVAINRFGSDTDGRAWRRSCDYCRARGVEAFSADHWARGRQPVAEALAAVAAVAAEPAPGFKPLYDDAVPLWEKIRTIARTIYGAPTPPPTPRARTAGALEQAGFGRLPVCIAKTQYSFSTDPALRGAPEGHV